MSLKRLWWRMTGHCYQATIVKCHSNRHVFVSTSKMVEILYSGVDFVVTQCVIKSLRNFSGSDFVVAQCVIKSSTLCSDYICIYPMSYFNYPLLWAYIKICPPAMHLHTSLTYYHFIYTLLTHYPLEYASLPDPRMEWASILLLWLAHKACHLFGANHIWKEMLGVS
jgi:hypothetical protein